MAPCAASTILRSEPRVHEHERDARRELERRSRAPCERDGAEMRILDCCRFDPIRVDAGEGPMRKEVRRPDGPGALLEDVRLVED